MMHLFSVVLLVVAASLACAAEDTASMRFPRGYLDEKDSAPAQRFLRVYDNENDEERVPVGNVLNSIMTSTLNAVESAKLKVFLLQKSSGVDVLNSLKLGDDAAAALKNSKLETLNKYVTRFNQENPDKTISLVGTLTTRYGDDALAKALVSAQTHAKSSAEMVTMAKKLRAEQLSAWLGGGKSVEDVYALLKLDEDGYLALTSRKLDVLDDYIVKINSEKNGQETLLKTLTKEFGGEKKLRAILNIAGLSYFTHVKAFELKKLIEWKNRNSEPAAVMKLLNLDNDVGKALKSTELRRLDEYIIDFNLKNPNNQATLLRTLTKKYGESGVAKAIVSAVKDDNMLAKRLQNQQFEDWLKKDMSVDQVFNVLDFKSAGIGAVISRNVDTLDKYVTLYNRKTSADETLVGAFVKAFGKKQLGNMLQRFPDTDKYSAKLRTQFRELN
ncbi:secreted RxLR effector peptide protein, putative [Phytophthora infestans T30-4]|uniref:Secreted RxLR effector peptide protein, putative n=2 Tax=Phytophthora infestans TaxID=4787 RepID=D0NF42_PHYIT|nr:secreted RxLR effector peptide protein, putative [Phytophthora infestans T30-4]EEY56831.1 secreted RxLR effector peptide protein, putative [Phytophthora infestans T30-4]KAF4046390.1 hypothetical protein GN244_ATG01225 [Phytophthora infestans]KAF4145416.1 hypothetical protein GN958_ATG05446 [Phytophthora infestans]|eukprot:XP_002902159.1 secreted RxLR effector peptide protein, putative [Phytophthora infestans T30-4]